MELWKKTEREEEVWHNIGCGFNKIKGHISHDLFKKMLEKLIYKFVWPMISDVLC